MKAPAFRYHAPKSLAEAVDLMGSLDNPRALAGGQSLMPMLNLRLAAPDHLIDLGRIPELVGIGGDDARITVGAMTTQRAVEQSSLVSRASPLLSEAVYHVGHQQTRNRGTIGGSLCHLDPGAELPVAALALDAELTIAGPSGTRILPFRDFPADYLTVTLEPDEILIGIAIPKAGARHGSAFLEFNRRPADFAVVSVAAQMWFGEAGTITRAAIAVGGVQYTPRRIAAAEMLLEGLKPGEDSFQAAADTVSDLDCDGDDLYPADYRRELCGVLIRRALHRAAERAGVSGHV